MKRFIEPDELARDRRFKRARSRNQLLRSLPDDVDTVVRVLEKVAPKILERIRGTALEPVYHELGPGFSFLTTVGGTRTDGERTPLQLRMQLHGIFVGELQALEAAGRTIWDFPDAPWEFKMNMARQCWDEMALPLHAEFRTLPMLFYVPPLLPVMATLSKQKNATQSKELGDVVKRWDDDWLYDTSTQELFGTIDDARFPLQYMANLFAAGDVEKVSTSIKKLMAVRIYRRFKTVGDITEERANEALNDVGLTQQIADDIYYLTSLPKFDDRFVIPAAHREQAIEMLENTGDKKGSSGFGFKEGSAVRGL